LDAGYQFRKRNERMRERNIIADQIKYSERASRMWTPNGNF
jgi:hypothetical protein